MTSESDDTPALDRSNWSFGATLRWHLYSGIRPKTSAKHRGEPWTEQELADALGTEVRNVQNWLNDRNSPKRSTLIHIIKVVLGPDADHEGFRKELIEKGGLLGRRETPDRRPDDREPAPIAEQSLADPLWAQHALEIHPSGGAGNEDDPALAAAAGLEPYSGSPESENSGSPESENSGSDRKAGLVASSLPIVASSATTRKKAARRIGSVSAALALVTAGIVAAILMTWRSANQDRRYFMSRAAVEFANGFCDRALRYVVAALPAPGSLAPSSLTAELLAQTAAYASSPNYGVDSTDR